MAQRTRKTLKFYYDQDPDRDKQIEAIVNALNSLDGSDIPTCIGERVAGALTRKAKQCQIETAGDGLPSQISVSDLRDKTIDQCLALMAKFQNNKALFLNRVFKDNSLEEGGLRLDMCEVPRIGCSDIEIVDKTGISRIAVAESVPIYLDKATQQVKLEYLSSLGGINFALGGIDAYQFLADTLKFANDAKFIQNLAGLKDASGAKRIVIVQPGDDLKSVIENSTAGQIICLTGGTHTVTSTITWPAHRLVLLALGGAVVDFNFSSNANAWNLPSDRSTVAGTLVVGIHFTASGAGHVTLKMSWQWDVRDCEFSGNIGGLWGRDSKFSNCYFHSNATIYVAGWRCMTFECCRIDNYLSLNVDPVFIACEITKGIYFYARQIEFYGCYLNEANIKLQPSSDIKSTIVISGGEFYKSIVMVNNWGMTTVKIDGARFTTDDEVLWVRSTSRVRVAHINCCSIYPVSGSPQVVKKDSDATIEQLSVTNCVGNATLDASLADSCDFYGNNGISITGV